MAGHHRVWGDTFLDALAEHFDVIAYDHRGIGSSTDVEGEFTIADLADDAVLLLDALGVARAHVFGISMGGMVAQELALNHADRVQTLVLGCTYAGGEGSQLMAPGPMRMFEAMRTRDPEIAVRAAYGANLSQAYVAVEENYPPFRESSLSVRVPVPTVMRQVQAAAAHDASERLGSVGIPTLVIHGTEDEMLVYANGEHVSGLVPGSTLHTFEGTGHLFWLEQPTATVELVRRHCQTAAAAAS
jgi:pimeloyl-ACP methyl ester carboxylesterase